MADNSPQNGNSFNAENHDNSNENVELIPNIRHRKISSINQRLSNEKNIYNINEIKNVDYAKKCIDVFLKSKNKIIQKKTAQELNIIGLCYRILKNYDEAIKYFNRAIDADKTYKAPYFNIGTIYYLKNEFNNAEKYFLKSLQIYCNDFLSLLYLGYCYKDTEKYDKAIEYLEKAICVMPDNYEQKAEIFVKIGDSYFRKNNIKESVRNVLKGFYLSENNLSLIAYICEVYNYNKEYKKALLYSNYLVKHDSNNYEYLSNHAELKYILNKNKEAEKLFKKLILRNSTDYKNYIYLARIYKEEKNFKLAEKNYLKVDYILKNDIQKCIEIGNFYNEINKKDKAFKYYLKAVKIDPNNIDTYQKVLPFIFENVIYAKDFENIIDEQIIKENNNIYEFYTYKSGLLTARKLYKDALEVLDSAIKNNPKELRAYQIAEVLYKELNNYEKADEMSSFIRQLK